ncbi:FAD/NAD-P-binding domain-containing protein [Agrocybe pediades]|nr:FAD/NAD-P-binding domain-containing protein [Agrocybe pediades]
MQPVYLPTLDKLGVEAAALENLTLPVDQIAQDWLNSFTSTISAEGAKTEDVLSLLHPDAWWRDILALTWDFRSLQGHVQVGKFVTDRVISSAAGWKDIAVATGEGMKTVLLRPYPDLVWIQFFITFNTNVGNGVGIVRLVPTPDAAGQGIVWKAFMIFTTLTGLKDHPETLGEHRNPLPNHGFWPSKRQAELDYADREPTVVIVGAGQSGLDVAARLKTLGVDALIIERSATPGEQWKNRYEALCLHDPVWYDHMPYIPFPKTWPVFTPAPKLAGWLRAYAEAMELNIWTSSTIHSMRLDEEKKIWTVKVTRGGDKTEERVLKPKYVIFAIGLGSGVPTMPDVPGMDQFKGTLLHSKHFGTAKDYVGKKALVVGACTSAHDIAQDFYNYGVDVTMVQRSSTYIMSTKNGWPDLFKGTYEENGPPTDVADWLTASMPLYFGKVMIRGLIEKIAEKDRQILEDLNKAGFKTNNGIDGSGFAFMAAVKAGGYYLDVGTSRLIADKKIKLVSGTNLSRFTENSVVFEDGREVECDVVVCATGFGDGRGPIIDLIGPEQGAKLIKIWGLDEEGETNSAWRWSGVENLYVMVGNLAKCRFHSLHIALQIKAMEEGLWDGKRYSERA